jgi:hypothetical protein
MAIIELYTKNQADDSDYDSRLTDITSDIEIYINQIRNIFSAEAGSVMGAADMGVGLETLIYEFSVSEKVLEKQIATQIQKYCTLHYKFKTIVQVKFARGNIRDIAFIDVVINDKKKFQVQIR